MTQRRPLPDSDEMQDRRRNERMVRWATIIIGVIMASLVVLLALRWILQE